MKRGGRTRGGYGRSTTRRRTAPKVNATGALSEHEEQCAVIRWKTVATATMPELRWLYAVPNGGYRTKTTAVKLVREGVVAGVPDLVLAVPRGEHHGLYVEMKATKGGRLSKEQAEWIAGLTANGYRATVCKGADEAIAVITNYLSLGVAT